MGKKVKIIVIEGVRMKKKFLLPIPLMAIPHMCILFVVYTCSGTRKQCTYCSIFILPKHTDSTVDTKKFYLIQPKHWNLRGFGLLILLTRWGGHL